jgi:hypothetical protein
MPNLISLKNELVSVRTQMKSIDLDSDDFDAENWNSLEDQEKVLQRKIKQAELKVQQEEEVKQQAQLATTPATPIAPATTKHVTGMQDGFATMDGMGYSCLGELMADHISIELYGEIRNDNADNFRSKRYKHYCDAQGIYHVAGTASTITDGLEVVADILPERKEYGKGNGVDEVMALFNPVSTARKELGFYINEDTYNVDGLVTQRIQEGQSLTEQRFSVKYRRFRLNKVGVFAKITEEDLQNVPLLQTRYANRAPATIEVQKVIDIISGSGIGEPVGITDDSNTSKIVVPRSGGASTITYPDLGAMEKQYFRQNGVGVYLCNQSSLGQLTELADTNGRLLWKPSLDQGVTNSIIHGTLNNRPLIVSEDCPALANEGALTLFNPAGYIFANHVSGIRFAESMHFFFDSDAMAMRWLSQYGGSPAFENAYEPRKGGEDLSHFVLLG